MNDDHIAEHIKAAPTAKERARLALIIMSVLFGWTYIYNLLVKEMNPLASFFEILNTISDDFVMGSLVTLSVGLLILVAFTITKLYTQIIANLYSFRIIEEIIYGELFGGYYRDFVERLLNFEDQPQPTTIYPRRASSMLASLAFIYMMSWLYVIVFSEALFFVSWSAGVNLPINAHNLLILPTLALSIPFSARVMAYLRYPYTQDYADFMPGAVFILLLVAALGQLFESDDQKFFLRQVMRSAEYKMIFLRNGAFLAFIPLFSEAMFWLLSLSQEKDDNA